MATQPTLMTIFQAKNNPNKLIRAHQAQNYNRFELYFSRRFFISKNKVDLWLLISIIYQNVCVRGGIGV